MFILQLFVQNRQIINFFMPNAFLLSSYLQQCCILLYLFIFLNRV